MHNLAMGYGKKSVRSKRTKEARCVLRCIPLEPNVLTASLLGAVQRLSKHVEKNVSKDIPVNILLGRPQEQQYLKDAKYQQHGNVKFRQNPTPQLSCTENSQTFNPLKVRPMSALNKPMVASF